MAQSAVLDLLVTNTYYYNLCNNYFLKSTICWPAWVKVDGIVYKISNAYLVLDTDGLDPVFGRLDDILVINSSVVAFSVAKCKTLYFDEHYHSYAIRVTSEQLLYNKLLCWNVYHLHTVCNGCSYISLKYIL